MSDLEPQSLKFYQYLACIFHTYAVGNDYGFGSELKYK